MYIIYAYRLVAVGLKFNVEKEPTINFVGGGVKNDHTCSMAPRVHIKYKLHWDEVGSNLTLKNDPKLPLDRVGVKF